MTIFMVVVRVVGGCGVPLDLHKLGVMADGVPCIMDGIQHACGKELSLFGFAGHGSVAELVALRPCTLGATVSKMTGSCVLDSSEAAEVRSEDNTYCIDVDTSHTPRDKYTFGAEHGRSVCAVSCSAVDRDANLSVVVLRCDGSEGINTCTNHHNSSIINIITDRLLLRDQMSGRLCASEHTCVQRLRAGSRAHFFRQKYVFANRISWQNDFCRTFLPDESVNMYYVYVFTTHYMVMGTLYTTM